MDEQRKKEQWWEEKIRNRKHQSGGKKQEMTRQTKGKKNTLGNANFIIFWDPLYPSIAPDQSQLFIPFDLLTMSIAQTDEGSIPVRQQKRQHIASWTQVHANRITNSYLSDEHQAVS